LAAGYPPLFWLSKGLVTDAAAPGGYALPHQLLGRLWPAPVGVASGPTFADEVARGLPAALTIAATDKAVAARFAALVRSDAVRAYESDDLAGVEIGAATKNVLAIAAGASDGLGYGHNARAALITRGLAETGRLSAALGGRRDTLMGLAGLGDLVLTCTGDLSRNRRVGLMLAAGQSLPAILADLGHVAEGVHAARAVAALSRHHDVDMPICAAVLRVLDGEVSPQAAVEALLRREPKSERQ
jgi:glycerol-3-phosphate dehydrogenase (NAD(P)+)